MCGFFPCSSSCQEVVWLWTQLTWLTCQALGYGGGGWGLSWGIVFFFLVEDLLWKRMRCLFGVPAELLAYVVTPQLRFVRGLFSWDSNRHSSGVSLFIKNRICWSPSLHERSSALEGRDKSDTWGKTLDPLHNEIGANYWLLWEEDVVDTPLFSKLDLRTIWLMNSFATNVC